MASISPSQEPGTSNTAPTYEAIQAHCANISQLLKDTKKEGAEDLRNKIELLDNALGSNGGAINPLPQPSQLLEKLQTVEAAVRYWTDKRLRPKLRRHVWNPLRHSATPANLGRCSENVQGILDSFQPSVFDRNQPGPSLGLSEATPPVSHQHTHVPISGESSRNINPTPPPATLPDIRPATPGPETSDAIPTRPPDDTAIPAVSQSAALDRNEPGPRLELPEASPPEPDEHNTQPTPADPPQNFDPDLPPATLPADPTTPATSDAMPTHQSDDTPEPAASQPMINNFSSGLPQIGNAKPAQLKDAFLGGFRVFLTKASGIADVIPDPFGKIVKSIADTGVEIMDVLDDVDSNHDEACNLGAHINSLAQAIVQFLPPSSGSGTEPDEQLETTLQSFSRTLAEVFNGLQSLRSQGKFTNMALHEQNRADLQGYDQTIRRAFESLQVRLQLHALRSLSEQERERLYDRLGAADNGAKDKAPTPEELLCLPGTRELILSRIHTWIETPSPSRVMWLNGVAGCGKSTIAATVFHDLQQLSRTAAIFYCTANDQPRCSTIVSTLAYWLADASHGSLEKPIRQAIAKHPKVSTLQLSEQIELLLSTPLATIADGAPPAVIIIDGLDEWFDTAKVSALVSLLCRMATGDRHNVKILITSRDLSHIHDSFPTDNSPDNLDNPNEDANNINTPSVWKFALDEEDLDAVEADIRVYLEHNLRQICRKTKLRKSWPSPAQLDALVRKSDHLFQFAATTVRYIRLGHPPDALDAILNNAQASNLKELDNLYMTILRAVFDSCLNDVTEPVLQHVLQFLVCSAVPVGLDVIAYLGNGELNADDDYIRIRQSALNHLGSFLVAPEDPHQPIRFLHTSIVDFLADSARCNDTRFFVDRTQGHTHLARRCLERLNRDLKRDICGLDGTYSWLYSSPDAGFDKVVTAAICPGLRYASLHWTHHLELVPASPIPVETVPLVHTFASTHILHWLEVLAFLRSVLSVGHPAARKAAGWCSRISSTDLLAPISLFHDTTRFIGLYVQIISIQPSALYEYILSFIPAKSMLRKMYGTRIQVIRGPSQNRWPAHQWKVYHGGDIRCIAVSSAGLIASGGDSGKIRLWDATSGMERGEPLERGKPLGGGPYFIHAVQSLGFSRDGKILVSSFDDNTIQIWDVETGRARGSPLTGHTRKARGVAISPDNTVVASGSDDGTVRCWDLETGREMGEPLDVEAGGVRSVAFTPDGSIMVCGCRDGGIQRWNVKTRKAVGEAMRGHTTEVRLVCVSPNGKVIVSGSEDRSIRRWDSKTGEQIGAPLEGHTRGVLSVAFIPDGETLVSGSKDMTIRLWDPRTGEQRVRELTDSVSKVAFTADAKTAISASYNGAIRAWDVDGEEEEEEEEPVVEVKGNSRYMSSVAFTSDARFVATAFSDGLIMLWSAETGTLLGKVESRYVGGEMRFSTCGRVLSHHSDELWDVSEVVKGTGAEICPVESDETLEFPYLSVGKMYIDHGGWIGLVGRVLDLWVPEAYGWRDYCYLFGTKLVLPGPLVSIFDVAGIL